MVYIDFGGRRGRPISHSRPIKEASRELLAARHRKKRALTKIEKPPTFEHFTEVGRILTFPETASIRSRGKIGLLLDKRI